jgi:hypothetical protein
MLRRILAAAALSLLLTAPIRAQSLDETNPGFAQMPRHTAHPGLRLTGSPYTEDVALQAPNFAMMPRPWYLEVRGRTSPRFSGKCLDCGEPVVLVNHTHCSRCDAAWWTSGRRGWDFPLEQ